MFENVDGRTDGRTTDGRTTDGRTTDAGVTGILIAHLGAFGSGELKIQYPNSGKSHKGVSRRIRRKRKIFFTGKSHENMLQYVKKRKLTSTK